MARMIKNTGKVFLSNNTYQHFTTLPCSNIFYCSLFGNTLDSLGSHVWSSYSNIHLAVRFSKQATGFVLVVSFADFYVLKVQGLNLPCVLARVM